MSKTKDKGDLGEGIILADILKRGYKVAIPLGENWDYDLIVLRKKKLERVQCKYTESTGKTISVYCRSSNNWNIKKYSAENVDWIACYDKKTDQCYYIPSSMLGKNVITLRITPPANHQKKGIWMAKDFLKF